MLTYKLSKVVNCNGYKQGYAKLKFNYPRKIFIIKEVKKCEFTKKKITIEFFKIATKALSFYYLQINSKSIQISQTSKFLYSQIIFFLRISKFKVELV